MRGRRLLLALGALFLLLGAALVGDWYAQNNEMDRLLGRIEAAEDTVNRFIPAAESILGEYIGREPITVEERDTMFARIERAAAESSRAVERRIARVDDTSFLPWHRDLARARDRYVHHARIWQAYLQSVARDPEPNYPNRSPEIIETYLVALDDLRRAVPSSPRHDFEARIKDLEP